MTQPIKLQLNAEAIAALFPEGSEHRLELQNAVVAEFYRKHFKASTFSGDFTDLLKNHVAVANKELRNAKDQVIAQVFKEQGISTGWGVSFNAETKAAFANEVRMAINSEINKAIAVNVDAQMQKLTGTITHNCQAAVNRLVDSEINTAVKQKIAAVMINLGQP